MGRKQESDLDKLIRQLELGRGKMMGRKQEADPENLITLLELSIGAYSLKATERINDAWASVTGEDPMSFESNYTVRFEMLFFFLHMSNRFAFMYDGQKARDTLQDAIVPNAIEKMIKVSWTSGDIKNGFDFDKWYSDMFDEQLKRMNEAEMDYGSCTEMIIGNGLSDEEGVIGKLPGRISRLVGLENTSRLRTLICATVVDALDKSELAKLVVEACSALRWREVLMTKEN